MFFDPPAYTRANQFITIFSPKNTPTGLYANGLIREYIRYSLFASQVWVGLQNGESAGLAIRCKSESLVVAHFFDNAPQGRTKGRVEHKKRPNLLIWGPFFLFWGPFFLFWGAFFLFSGPIFSFLWTNNLFFMRTVFLLWGPIFFLRTNSISPLNF